MFRTLVLEKFLKKYKQKGEKDFNKILDKEFQDMIENSLKSRKYEKISFKLGKIAKKLKYIKKDLYYYFKKEPIYIKICNDSMEIFEKECGNILFNKFKEIKDKYYDTYLSNTKIDIQNRIYIIYDINFEKEKNYIFGKCNNDIKKLIKEGNDLDILKGKRNIFNIIVFFIKDIRLFLITYLKKINDLKNDALINSIKNIYEKN